MLASLDSATTSHEAAGALARECVEAVRLALGLELDFSPETLPLVDHYCLGLPREAETIERASRLAGAYFGEVVRRRFGCRWHVEVSGSLGWRLEFERCFLYFNPVGVALEMLLGSEVPAVRSGFVTWPDAAGALAERLDRLPPVSEGDYFALAVRFEVLETVVDFLLAHKEETQPEVYDAAFYRAQVEARREDVLAD